jgi:DnaJ-class molecular chaperone
MGRGNRRRKTIDVLDARVSVNIPAGIQTGKSIRIAIKGFRISEANAATLYLKIRIVNPDVVTETPKICLLNCGKITQHTA